MAAYITIQISVGGTQSDWPLAYSTQRQDIQDKDKLHKEYSPFN